MVLVTVFYWDADGKHASAEINVGKRDSHCTIKKKAKAFVKGLGGIYKKYFVK
jgi:hypothetical protein